MLPQSSAGAGAANELEKLGGPRCRPAGQDKQSVSGPQKNRLKATVADVAGSDQHHDGCYHWCRLLRAARWEALALAGG